MGQFSQKDEQYLFQIAADFLKQKTELEKLREAVRLEEFAKTLSRSNYGAARLIRKSSICLPDLNCASSQRGRLPRPDQLSEG